MRAGVAGIVLIVAFLNGYKQTSAQHTVSTISYTPDMIHVWDDDPDFRPGFTAYILDNGNLVKTKRHSVSVGDPIWAGGGGAFVEILDWDNNLLWSFEQNDSLHRLHHDIAPMPNGNILMISWELKTAQQAFQAGLDSTLLPGQGELWPDYILEVDPSIDSVVWEWHAWDHLIQDYDPGKENYGVVEDHPELIDINFEPNNIVADWMHSNAIDYNEELDQVLLCVAKFHEVWIIDHSTTTAEAAGHIGGLSGRGGDLMYRWGNPAAHRAGSNDDRKLFFPHDIHWIDDFVDTTYQHYGKLGVFNNRANPNYSTVDIITPIFNMEEWAYFFSEGTWMPANFDLTITHPEPTLLYSQSISSVQFLPNGNALICSGRSGFSFELTPEHEIVWEYITPLVSGTPATQGEPVSNNQTFRLKRYPLDFEGFENKNLEPIGYIEMNPDTAFCDEVVRVERISGIDLLKIHPNPASDYVKIKSRQPWQGKIIDSNGIVYEEIPLGLEKTLSVYRYSNGIYTLVAWTQGGIYCERIVVMK
jgi:hypothetical protein